MTTLPVIDVSGGPAARGEAYGRQAAALIEHAVGHYRRDFAVKGIGWEEATGIARQFWDAIVSFDGKLAEEIAAIAAASGQSLEAIVLLNARTEILFWRERERQHVVKEAVEVEGCTSALAMPEATADGFLLHGQNWDWMPEVANHTMALRIRDADGPNGLHFVEAGQLARHGFSEAGIAVTAMGLHSGGDYGRIGVPSPLIRRRILESATFGEAIGQVLGNPASFSHALIVSHSDGEAFCFETTPEETFWLEPQDDILVHANHFKSPTALVRIRDVNLARCPDSLYRDTRVRRSLSAEHGQITTDSFQRCFSDEFGRPNSVMRHPFRRPGGLLSVTVYTLVMTPGKQTAKLALRPYEGVAFQEISLN